MRSLALLLPITLMACTSDTGKDSGERLDLPTMSDVDASLSEAIPTVITVTWNTDSEVSGWIEYGANGALDHSTSLTDANTAHEMWLLGMTADTEVSYRVMLESDGGTVEGEVQTITTGSMPLGLPDISTSGDTTPGSYMILPWLGVSSGILILSPEGAPVWWYPDESGLQIYRARLSNDGQSIMFNRGSISGDPSADSQLVQVSLDGTEETAIDIPLLAHDFVELDDGTIGAMVIEFREDEDGEEIRGDSLIEIAPDGTQSTIWSAWDSWDPETENSGDAGDEGWTFANALNYNAADDAWQLSVRNFSSIVQIGRSSGEVEWGFGGVVNDFDITGTPFLHQHQFDIANGTILVFDNDGISGNQSRVVEYSFDVENRTAEEIWSYMPTPSVYCFVLGDVQRLANDDRLITWSAVGTIEQVNTAGESLFQLTTSLGYAFGFNTLEDSLYRSP